jgi:hypothetical protein
MIRFMSSTAIWDELVSCRISTVCSWFLEWNIVMVVMVVNYFFINDSDTGMLIFGSMGHWSS